MNRFRKVFRTSLIAIALLAAWNTARAEEPSRAGEMRAALEQVMIVRMKQVLDLTPKQEKLVVPRVERLLQARRDFAARRRAALAHLRSLMKDDAADAAEIADALRKVDLAEKRFSDRQRGLMEAIRKELSPRQQAGLYFFEQHFRKTMQRRLQQARGNEPRGRRGNPHRRPGGPVDDEPESDRDPFEGNQW